MLSNEPCHVFGSPSQPCSVGTLLRRFGEGWLKNSSVYVLKLWIRVNPHKIVFPNQFFPSEMLAGKQEVKDFAQRIDVGLCCNRCSATRLKFWRYVETGADLLHCLSQALLFVREIAESKIKYHHLRVVADQYIVRFEIPVDYRGLVRVVDDVAQGRK